MGWKEVIRVKRFRNLISPLITIESESEEEQPSEEQRLTCKEIGLSIFDRKTVCDRTGFLKVLSQTTAEIQA